jgi:hypothetical protein
MFIFNKGTATAQRRSAMRYVFFVTGVFFLLLAAPAHELDAQFQGSAQPGDDRFTVELFGGQFSPNTTYRDGSSFDSGGMVGGGLTLWVNRNLGFNLGIATAETPAPFAADGSPTIITGADPRTTVVLADARARFPMLTGEAVSLVPYIAAGGGVKDYRYNRHGLYDEMRFALTGAAGSEVRFGQGGNFSVRAELRNVLSQFRSFGEERAQSDWMFSGGLIVSF